MTKYNFDTTFYWKHLFEEGSGADNGTDNGANDNNGGDDTGAGNLGNVNDGATNTGAQNPELKYTDADIDHIISQKFAKWQKQQEAAVSEAAKLAKMNEQQKAEYEKEKALEKQKELEAELAQLKGEKERNELTATARKMLKEKNIVLDDALLSFLVSDDAETTSTNVNAFADLFQKSIQDGVKAALRTNTPKAGAGGKTLTKEEILKIDDAAERRKLIAENMELFR